MATETTAAGTRTVPPLTYATDDDLDAAIGRRNVAWARWQEAREWLEATAADAPDILARRRDYNAAQDEYEAADRYLVRVRVWRQTVRAAA